MAAKKIEIVYDINNKPIDVAIQSTLNLKQQVRELTKEVNKTKEGTEEFRLLSAKLNETRDNMERVKAKSGELFNTLSLLPGPIGDFSNSLDNGINLLKTFSGFKFSDIGNQFKELGKDIGDVISNMFGLTTATKADTVAKEENIGATEAQTAAVVEQTSAVEADTVANEALTVAEEEATAAAGPIGLAIAAITAIIAVAIVYWDKLSDAITGSTKVTKAYDEGLVEAGKNVAKFEEDLYKVKTAFAEAKAGTISKKDALKEYNDTLGKTVGYASSLEEAEKLMKANEGYVIDSIKQKTIATIMYGKAAQVTADLISGKTVDKSAWEKLWTGIKSGGDPFMYLTNMANDAVDAMNEATTDIDKFTEAGNKATQAAIEDEKKLQGQRKYTPEQLKQMAQDRINMNAKLAESEAALADSTIKASKNEIANIELAQGEKDKVYDTELKRINALMAFEGKGTKEYKALLTERNNLTAAHNKDRIAMEEAVIAKLKEMYDKNNATSKANVEKESADKLKDLDKVHQDEINNNDVFYAAKQHSEIAHQESTFMLNKDYYDKQKEQLITNKKDEQDRYDLLLQAGLIGQEQYNTDIADMNKKYDDAFEVNDTKNKQNTIDREKFLAQTLIDTKQYEKDAVIGLEEAKINAVGALGNIIGQLAGKNKDLQILGLLITQGAAIADIVSKYWQKQAEITYLQGVYASLIPDPFTSAIGVAGVAATTASRASNTIGMVTGIAGVGAAIATGIAQINGAGGGAAAANGQSPAANSTSSLGRNYGDGGLLEGPRHAAGGMMINAEGGEAVMTRGAVTMFAPLLSTLNQMGGGTSFGKGVVGQANYDAPMSSNSNTPVIKTYVVSNELTSQAEKNARLKDLSTL